MPKSGSYEELVAQAERAVAAVKDPELKRAAFEKVLDDLLSSRGAREEAAPSQARIRKAKSSRPKSAAAKSGPTAYIEELLDDGFFKKPKTIAEVKAELANRGHHIPLTSLSGPLQKLTQRRVLRRHRAATSGNQQTFNYSNW
jgi:hypothetical protein